MTSSELAQRLYDIAHRKSNRSQRVRDMELLLERREFVAFSEGFISGDAIMRALLSEPFKKEEKSKPSVIAFR